MENYNELLQKLTELKEKLQPLPPVLSESDHLKAHFRLAFEEVYSLFFQMEDFINYSCSEQTKKESELNNLKKQAQEAVSQFNKLTNLDNVEPWEAFASTSYFNTVKNGLTTMHSGDCTGFPSSCERCLSESIYKIDYSAQWSKSQGHSMSYQYDALFKQKNALEVAQKLDNTLDKKNQDILKHKI